MCPRFFVFVKATQKDFNVVRYDSETKLSRSGAIREAEIH